MARTLDGAELSQPCSPLWKGKWAGNYLAFLIADPPVELLPLQAQEVLPRLDDAALGCNGPGCVDVVPSHHADCDASTLAFADSFRDLKMTIDVGGAIKARHCCVQAFLHPDLQHPLPPPLWS